MEKRLTLEQVLEWTLVLLISGTIMLIGNAIGYHTGVLESVPGMLILIAISVVGMSLSKLIPFNIPAILYISVIGIAIAVPASPISSYVVEATRNIQLLAICTTVLVYTGVSIGKSWAEFKKIGWRGIIVTLLVLFGTFFISAVCAQIFMKLQGIV